MLFHTSHALSGNLYNGWSIGYPWQIEVWVNMTHQYLTEYLDDYSCDSENVKPCIKTYFKSVSVEKLIDIEDFKYGFDQKYIRRFLNSIVGTSAVWSSKIVYDYDFIKPDDKSIDFTGYTTSYGTLNYDGSVMAYNGYLNQDFERTNKDETTYQYLVHEFNRLSEDCGNDKNCVDDVTQVFMKNEVWPLDARIEGNNENDGGDSNTDIDTVVSVRALIYDEYSKKFDLENNDRPLSEKLQVPFMTDSFFAREQLSDYQNTKNNGGKVKVHHIARSLQQGYTPCAPQAYDFDGKNPYTETDWAFHADDLFYFFGRHICVGERECQEKNSPKSDQLADLSTIHSVFNKPGKLASELEEDNIEASFIDQDGNIFEIENYWRQQKNLYQNVIPDLWSRKVDNLEEDVTEAPSSSTWVVLNAIWMISVLEIF